MATVQPLPVGKYGNLVCKEVMDHVDEVAGSAVDLEGDMTMAAASPWILSATGSRSIGTTYTNNTDYPVKVMVTLQAEAAGLYRLQTEGAHDQGVIELKGQNNVNYIDFGEAWVMPGKTFRVREVTAASGVSILYWFEQAFDPRYVPATWTEGSSAAIGKYTGLGTAVGKMNNIRGSNSWATEPMSLNVAETVGNQTTAVVVQVAYSPAAVAGGTATATLQVDIGGTLTNVAACGISATLTGTPTTGSRWRTFTFFVNPNDRYRVNSTTSGVGSSVSIQEASELAFTKHTAVSFSAGESGAGTETKFKDLMTRSRNAMGGKRNCFIVNGAPQPASTGARVSHRAWAYIIMRGDITPTSVSSGQLDILLTGSSGGDAETTQPAGLANSAEVTVSTIVPNGIEHAAFQSNSSVDEVTYVIFI